MAMRTLSREPQTMMVAPGKGRVGEKKHPQTCCSGFGGNHLRANCRFKNVNSLHCGKKGHLAIVCKASQTAELSQSSGQPQFRRQPHRQTRQGDDCYSILEEQPET
ncbi:hypothetical protein E2320_014864, partial [Naja naja]